MPSQIILASGNAGKVREIQAVLAESSIIVKPQSEFAVPEADEIGLTFVENAIIKARNAAVYTGQAAIGDDSGLEVDFLNGEPGIYSSRYANAESAESTESDSQANNAKLLSALKNVPMEKRSARFQCVIVYLRHDKDPTPIICQASWHGFISNQPSGDKGFGYDPLFFVPTHHCHAAELDSETKNQISHRGQAIRQLAEYFRTHS